MVYGLVYFLLIPCMYMLLIIYSFININNVSWGTRETVPTPSEQQKAAEQKAVEQKKEQAKKGGIVDMFSSLWRGKNSNFCLNWMVNFGFINQLFANVSEMNR